MNSDKHQWTIEYYFPLGNKNAPIAEFIENLPFKARAKLSNTFDLLIEFGTKIGMPHVKKLIGIPLWEIRVLGQDSIRVFYVTTVNNTFLLLHGFIKKKQKTPSKEIKTAINRLNEFKSRT